MAEGVLKPQLDALDADLVVLEEPYLAREESADLGAVEEALEVLAGGPKLALWLTFGTRAELLAQGVADLPVHAIGIDFYATLGADVPEGFGKVLLAGVLDARSSVLEEPREIAAFVETLRGRGGGARSRSFRTAIFSTSPSRSPGRSSDAWARPRLLLLRQPHD